MEGDWNSDAPDAQAFINNAKAKYFGERETRPKHDRQCLQETIANAFLTQNSAERFVRIFNAFAQSHNLDAEDNSESSDSDSSTSTESSSSSNESKQSQSQ